MRSKKGLTLGDLYPAVLALMIVGIVLGIGIYVLLQTSVAISTATKTVTNETFTTVTHVGVAASNVAECGFGNFAVVQAVNASTGLTIAPGNYTVDASRGLVYAATDEYNNTNWGINYTYEGGGTELYCTSLTTTNTGLGGMASWIAVIVVVFAAAIVVGVVLNSFGTRRSAI